MTRLVTLVGALVLSGSSVVAQGVRFSGGALVYAVQAGSPTEADAQSGTWWGVEARADINRISIRALGLAGSLGGNPSHVDRNARLTQLALRYRLTPWLSLGLDAEAQRLESSLSTTVWRMYGAGLTVSSSLGVEGLLARADLATFPASSVVASQDLGRPVRAEFGLTYRVRHIPIEGMLSYRMETMDFESAADLRFGGVLAGLLVRVGHH